MDEDIQRIAEEIDGERSRVYLLEVDLGDTRDLDRIWQMVDTTHLGFANWDLEGEYMAYCYTFEIEDERANAYYTRKIFEAKAESKTFCDPEIEQAYFDRMLVVS